MLNFEGLRSWPSQSRPRNPARELADGGGTGRHLAGISTKSSTTPPTKPSETRVVDVSFDRYVVLFQLSVRVVVVLLFSDGTIKFSMVFISILISPQATEGPNDV